MKKSLRYLGISHNTANSYQREKYHISDEEKSSLLKAICQTFHDITGLFILATCNRTEIYFEAISTTSDSIIDLLIKFKNNSIVKSEKDLFQSSNQTNYSVKHLLEVSSGLDSLVFGDAEIIAQIKKAHQFSMAHKLQGSLLERALQAVFKTHKRISNETDFRDGTTSVAYKALKVIRQSFECSSVKTKKILFIGTGDIVKQLFKYNSKFHFNNIYIASRNEIKVNALAASNNCHTYNWMSVINNNFANFDVIISAVSNCPNLIKTIKTENHNTLLIDLAVPCNISKNLAQQNKIIFHDLDSISVELEETKENRLAATQSVKTIIQEEKTAFDDWMEGATLRALLAQYRITINRQVQSHHDCKLETANIEIITNNVLKKLVAKNQLNASSNTIKTLIYNEIALIKN